MVNTNFLSVIRGNAQERNDDLAISIQAHLTLLLNTRRGMSPHLHHYGLPDIHSIYESLPHSLEELAGEIRETIMTYEPRLKKVNVDLASTERDNFRVTYKISGEIIQGSSVSRLTFETEVLRDGRSQTSLVRRYG